MASSLFITGTDTNVGKTIITAGLARVLYEHGIDVGVMKPFATQNGNESHSLSKQQNFRSKDVQILVNAANITCDSERLINPCLYQIPTSPFTAFMNGKVKPDLKLVFDSFMQLGKRHDVLLVEGIGGIMTPILHDYYVADLIREMNLSTLIIVTNKIGTINHTLMTLRMCQYYDLDVTGIIINAFDDLGYNSDELKRDLENLAKVKVLGIIPKIDDLSIKNIADVMQSCITSSFFFKP